MIFNSMRYCGRLSLKGLKYVRTIRKAPEAIYTGEGLSKSFCRVNLGRFSHYHPTNIMVAPCLQSLMNSQARTGYWVVDLFRVKPLPEKLLNLYRGLPILSVENHNQIGGIGGALCELFPTILNIVFRMGIQKTRFEQKSGRWTTFSREANPERSSIKINLSILHY